MRVRLAQPSSTPSHRTRLVPRRCSRLSTTSPSSPRRKRSRFSSRSRTLRQPSQKCALFLLALSPSLGHPVGLTLCSIASYRAQLVPSVSQAEMLHYKTVQSRFSAETLNSDDKLAAKEAAAAGAATAPDGSALQGPVEKAKPNGVVPNGVVSEASVPEEVVGAAEASKPSDEEEERQRRRKAKGKGKARAE